MTTTELLQQLTAIRNSMRADPAWQATIDEAIRVIRSTRPGSLNDVQGINPGA